MTVPDPGRSRVAIVQQPASVLDLPEGLRRARRWVGEAAAGGARLVVFPESWLGGYPAWMFAMAGWDDPVAKRWYAVFLRHSMAATSAEFGELAGIAREHDVTVVMGFNERSRPDSGTVYNAQVTFGPDGSVLNLHRKLTPSHTERLAWAGGDATGLRVSETPVGRVGGLICWEHWHPLARYALHAQDEQIHVAAWPDTCEMHLATSRTYAFEGRAYVLAAGLYLTADDVPDELRAAYTAGVGDVTGVEGLLFDGGSAVIGPDGSWVVEPVRGEPALVFADLDLRRCDEERHDLDLAGHYGRHDVFRLEVDRRAHAPMYEAGRENAGPTDGWWVR